MAEVINRYILTDYLPTLFLHLSVCLSLAPVLNPFSLILVSALYLSTTSFPILHPSCFIHPLHLLSSSPYISNILPHGYRLFPILPLFAYPLFSIYLLSLLLSFPRCFYSLVPSHYLSPFSNPPLCSGLLYLPLLSPPFLSTNPPPLLSLSWWQLPKHHPRGKNDKRR